MKNLSENKHANEQVLISTKIEEMLSVLERRNKLIANYCKSFVMPDEQGLEVGAKKQKQPVQDD